MMDEVLRRTDEGVIRTAPEEVAAVLVKMKWPNMGFLDARKDWKDPDYH